MTSPARSARIPDASRVSVAASTSRSRLWAARILTAIPVLFLLFDGVTKLMMIKPVTDGMAQLGYPVSTAFGIGVILLVCLALYAIPQTAVLGAVLLTGYLGGAIASNVRVGNPLFSYTLFPVYVAVLLCGGLYLREPRLRALIPFRKTDA
jgi:hypothetical protein